MSQSPLDTHGGTRWAADLALGTAIACAYAPVFRAGLIWDDDAHVTRQELQSLAGLRRIWFEPGATQQYYPVLHSAFWMEHRWWGANPLGYHALNVALHWAAALLLVRILLRLLDPAWPLLQRQVCAYGAAAVFALHPISVESVAWISEQKNTLSTVFALAAVLCYGRWGEPAEVGRRPGSRGAWYVASCGWYIAALLTKSVTATVPAAMLVAVWWRHGQLRKRDWLSLLPWLVAGGIMGAVTGWMERTQIGAQGSDFALSGVQRCILAGRIGWFYLCHLVWPTGQMFVYPRWTIDEHNPIQWIALVAALSGCAIAIGVWRRWRGPLAALLLFWGLLFPALGFLNVYPFIFSYVADHFAYLASLSFSATLSVGYCLLWKRVRWTPANLRTILVFPLVALSFLAALTHLQARSYRDSETLYRTTLKRNPDAWLADLNLGGILLERGQLKEARSLLAAAESLQPDYPLTHFDLGQLYLKQNDLVAAVAEFKASLRLRPQDAEACNNLGIALAQRGFTKDAISQFAAALQIRPNYPRAACNWSIVLMRQQRYPEARARLEEALRLSPGNAEAEALLRQLPQL